MKAYLINLPKAVERLEHAKQSLKKADIELIRVDAVMGKELTLPHPDYSESSYRYRHGKRTNLSELGCYFSHIKAMKMFLESQDEFALILEDDICFEADLKQVITEAIKQSDKWDLLRLSGLHRGTPVTVGVLDQTYRLAINLTRQTGSGAYVVNRKGAEQMVKHLVPMKLPYDHAYDKEWLYGYKALSVTPYPTNQQAGFESQINAARSYKLPGYKRHWSVLPYRAWTELSRLLYRSLRMVTLKVLG